MELSEISQKVQDSVFDLGTFSTSGDVYLLREAQYPDKIAGVWKKVPLSSVLQVQGSVVSWQCDAISHPQDSHGTPLEWNWNGHAYEDFLPVGNTLFNWTYGIPPRVKEGKEIFVDAYVIFNQTYRYHLLRLNSV